MKVFRDLQIWQRSVELVVEIYKQTDNYPKAEEYGLKSQLRRSAVSIPSNIAEGYGRRGNKEFKRFIDIAIGSLFELQTQLEISKRLNFLNEKQFDSGFELSREVERMIVAFRNKLV